MLESSLLSARLDKFAFVFASLLTFKIVRSATQMPLSVLWPFGGDRCTCAQLQLSGLQLRFQCLCYGLLKSMSADCIHTSIVLLAAVVHTACSIAKY